MPSAFYPNKLNRSGAFLFCLFVAIIIICAGCNGSPKATHHSSRRIVALRFVPHTPPPGGITAFVKYIGDTNESRVTEGLFGEFSGAIFTELISSNASGCSVTVRFDGSSIASGSKLNMTNIINIKYPQCQHVVIPHFGSVTGWFLSDEQLLEKRNMVGQ